jgi:anti-sigma regulatory factor (Ser/Thr protein kinase)
MRTGAAAGHAGYFHETALYGSDDDFVDVVRPFLRDGLDAGEAVLVACGPHNAALLRRSTDCAGVRFLPGGDRYARPGQAIHDYRRTFAELTAGGAAQIRVVGDVPHPGTGAEWDRWMRYEAAVNVAFAEFPVWGLCPYDTRSASSEVVHDVMCTHPHVARPGGEHRRNDAYVDPERFLADRARRPGAAGAGRVRSDDAPPALRLEDPSPRRARHELHRLAAGVLSPAALGDLAVITSELVTNAHVHGGPPVTVEAWVGPGAVELRVTDNGPGPADPLAGWRPPPIDRVGGRGLWLALQLGADLAVHTVDGVTVASCIVDEVPAPSTAPTVHPSHLAG